MFYPGSVSGFFGSLAVYPFDFVRKGVVVNDKTSNSLKVLHRFSSVPYAAVYFGLYFQQRDPNSLKSQSFWALLSRYGKSV